MAVSRAISTAVVRLLSRGGWGLQLYARWQEWFGHVPLLIPGSSLGGATFLHLLLLLSTWPVEFRQTECSASSRSLCDQSRSLSSHCARVYLPSRAPYI